ncbi:alpha/beta hydrolase [Agromyces larvae]|uniref:Alpha/beta hydrolase n=1 Tax=Agromyces larvae TaxID=2929802 RepID=A0ABY4BVP1_9MICO|nr:alpha/beta hydrolase [Agromyces larvae]UOE42969.1 alpha/beta hydrolase [Agromyces larvae]
MTQTRTRGTGGLGGRHRSRSLLIAAAVVAALATTSVLSAFHTRLEPIDPQGPDAASEVVGPEIVGIRTFTPPAGLRVAADLEYGTREDGTLLTLDVCLPPAVGLGLDLPAVVSVHGGSWARGDKANADWRNVCLWLASEGFVAASVNYRLVPDAVFPAQLEDVQLAVEWLRDPEQVERFDLDPARIGVFGGSAGGNLAALVGADGEGSLDEGSRVAAVVDLSGPVVLDGIAEGEEWLRGIVGAYLACDPDTLDTTGCPAAAPASPGTLADASDPPVFIGHAEQEIIPLVQSLGYAESLRAAGVPVELAVVPGGEHSIGILDAGLRERVAAFLHAQLG